MSRGATAAPDLPGRVHDQTLRDVECSPQTTRPRLEGHFVRGDVLLIIQKQVRVRAGDHNDN